MWLLALDTSGREASVAVFDDARMAALVATPGDEQHSIRLFREIESVLQQVKLGLSDIDLYAVANGPGAFTALRIGLTAVKSFAEMYGKPVVAVSALEAVCQHARADGLLVPVVDAYRGQVFGGLYEKKGSEIVARGPERVLRFKEFLAVVGRDVADVRTATLISPTLVRLEPELAGSALASIRREAVPTVLADAVGQRARAKLARREVSDAIHLDANYVRCSDAELLWKPK
jgi:tRNA threonylcarbamoyladenosine biosynthesis protein TsaB